LGGKIVKKSKTRGKIEEELMKTMKQQRELFRKKFGREPESDDPLFFEPDAEEPMPIEWHLVRDEVVRGMAAVGVDPAIIYAFRKTGLIVTEDNLGQMPPEAVEEWMAAMDDYHEQIEKRRPS
jgi:hypothetical protein